MYENIGGKIKGLSKTIAFIEIVIALIAGCWVIISDDEVALGFFIIIVGSLAAWVSSWLLYGFGEIIEKVCQIEQNTRKSDMANRKTEIENLYSRGNITEEEYKEAVDKNQNGEKV